ncbi:MAG: eIF2 kinase Gcn2p negative regulator [Pleopsidium flavum]|nr:MAG: eIF2 kinase Gcn2p negative regulator [Pleopsidium flavum]
MSEDLDNEIEAINSIYGPNTLVPLPLTTSNFDISTNIYILNLPSDAIAVRLHFPNDYPLSPPVVLGTQHVGGDVEKGAGTRAVEIVKDVLRLVFREGEVCLFDLVEEVGDVLKGETGQEDAEEESTGTSHGAEEREKKEMETVEDQPISTHNGGHQSTSTGLAQQLGEAPPWTISEVVTEKKSVFIARAAPVTSPAQAKQYIYHLLSTDKKVAKATHNITAWRIKGEGNTMYQDCDDDGETAAGGRVLHLMQVMDLWGVVVVVTRWYGGVQLGPDRFRIINSVARDAFVKGGFMKREGTKDGGERKKGKK